MKLKKLGLVVVVGFACLVWGSVHIVSAADAEKAKNSTDVYRLLDLFGDVFERVRSDYVEAPTDEELIEAAIT
jgi:carboxyl-terminal processing protease